MHFGVRQFRRYRRSAALIAVVLSPACWDKCPVGPSHDPTELVLSPQSITLTAIGDTARFTTEITNGHGDPVSATVSWESTNHGAATVSEGRAIAVGNGTATIIARAGEAVDSAPVVVRQQADRIEQISGMGQVGVAGTRLPVPLVVEARDRRGNVASEVELDLTVAGGGVLSPAAALTNAAGRFSTEWTLGPLATGDGAPQSVTISAAAEPSVNVVFSATAIPGQATALYTVLGDNQGWIHNETTGAEVVVRVVDPNDNGVPNTRVTFAPRNGGHANPPEVLTGPDGLAATEWFMGNVDTEPGTPGDLPDVIDVFADGVPGTIEVHGTVWPRTSEGVSEGQHPELSTARIMSSVLHSCPDSNAVLIIPAGMPGKFARVLSVPGDCADPMLVGNGRDVEPVKLSYEVPFFGLTRTTGFSFELSVRGIGFGVRQGDSTLCPVTGCDQPHAVASATPSSIPAGDNHQTVVRLDGSASYDPDGGALTYLWTLPNGARLVEGYTTTDAITFVTFFGSLDYTVGLEVTSHFGTSTAAVVIEVD